MLSTFELISVLIILLAFILIYHTTLRDPVKYTVECSAYLLLFLYLIKLFV